MKTTSLTTVILSALALGLVNAKSSSDLKTFVTDLGLSKADINAVISSYTDSSDKRPKDLSCQVLERVFPNSTNLPNESQYRSKVTINWSMRAWLNATCVFSPSSAKQTAIGVKVANFFNTKFAIRSGGHFTDPNFASITDGILFSLENLNQVTVDPSKNVASVGPGNRWGKVYEQLETKGFVVVGGRVPPVGVGGLLTGGGLSYFSGTEGFAADTVINYEVVLGNGTIVNANASENSDLWWALKGGGNNFGIVTRFDMKAIPKDNGLIWGGNLFFNASTFPDVIAAVAKFQAEEQVADPKAAIIVSFIQSSASNSTPALNIARITVFHQDPTDTIPPSLQLFFDIGPMASTAMIRTLSGLTKDVFGIADDQPSSRQAFRDVSVGVSKDLFMYALELFTTTFAPFISLPGTGYTLTYQPISVAMVDASNSTGGTLSVYREDRKTVNPRYPFDMITLYSISNLREIGLILSVQWVRESDDEIIKSSAKSLFDGIDAKAKEMGLDEDFLYFNDAAGDQPVLEGYGKENVARLKKVSKKFDPQQVFQKQVTGGFKLK